MPHGEPHPACFSSPTRAAPHSFRNPCSSCARWLVCPSRQLAGVISPRPPSASRRRALLPACFPSQPTASVLSLGPCEATCATRWPASPLSSPEFERPRPRHHWFAATARRRHLQSILRHPSITGEPNRFPCRSLAYPGTPSPPASSSSPSVPRGSGDLIAKALKLSRV
jgi:hypothetical protein